MSRRIYIYACTFVVLFLPAPAGAKGAPDKISWQQLQPGVEYAAIFAADAGKIPIAVKDDKLHLVRISPRQVKFRVLMASKIGKQNLTTAEWAKQHNLAVAINLGMYLADQSTHVGYLRVGKEVLSPRWAAQYKSLLALNLEGQLREGDAAVLKDLQKPGKAAANLPYDLVVQNLRLISSPNGQKGENVWPEQPKRWSEAALAMDAQGRLLFCFCRAPLSMWEFNNLLLSLPLDIIRAMHLEGGPEASLSLHAGGLNLDLCGSFESGIFPGDTNVGQWPIPNVLGVVAERTIKNVSVPQK